MRLRTMSMVFLGLLLLAGSSSSATKSIPLAAERTTIEAIATSRSSLTFQVDVGKLEVFDVSTKGGDFSRLVIPGFHSSKVEGAPELPMVNRLIAVPYGARVRVEILASESRLIDLKDFGVLNPLMPAQPSLPKNVDAADWPFVYDRTVYAQTKVARAEVVTVTGQGRLRAVDMARVEVSPVEYYPATNQVRVTGSLTFQIVFEGAGTRDGDDLAAATYSPFFEHLYAGLEGSKAFHDDYPDHVTDQVTMVIVTPPMFEDQLADFIAWKTERGFKVVLAVTGTPEVGTTTTSIQSYLHALFNDATVNDPAPSFVLFVGDVDQLPTFSENGISTDRPYCAVGDDIVPDMFYGRFSATNSGQLQAILDKTMIYDQYTMADPTYLEKVVLVAGVDAQFAATFGNGQINYGTTYYFNAAHGITDHTWLYPASDAAGVAAIVVETVGNGVGYVNYTAHGSRTAWADPSFTQSNVNSLGNSGQYSMVVGNCCLTSTYGYSECFSETWLRAPDKGAIGYIGAAANSLWDEDFWWGVGACAGGAINANPIFEETGLGAYDGVFHDHGESADTWYVTNDALIFSGNLAVLEAGSSNSTYYWNIYNLMGDPSLSTYFGVPTTNTVGHLASYPSTATMIEISADAGSYVGLTQEGVLVGSGTVGAGGSVTVDLKQVLTVGVALHIVVTAQNRQPYSTDVMVISPSLVTIDPPAIDAAVATDVTVTVMEIDGVTPIVGVDVWAFGLDYTSEVVSTNESGVVVLSVNYPYGPSVTINGQISGEVYLLFIKELTVDALPASGFDLMVSNELGVADTFYQNLPGTLTAVGGTGVMALMPSGTLSQTSAATLVVTPATGGEVVGYIASSGYDLYSETFQISTAGSIRGAVDLYLQGDHSGVVVTADPGGAAFTTDVDGNYQLHDLDPGTYELTASCSGYFTSPVSVTIAAGDHLESINFGLVPVMEFEACAQPGLFIPDNDPEGVSHSINCALDRNVAFIRLYVNIVHPFIDDLTVLLTTPEGTGLTLHSTSGGTADNLIGWYPDDLTPVSSLDACAGENMRGDWTLKVTDSDQWDTGTLMEWCLKIGYVKSSDDTNGVVPDVVTLRTSFPNPFNPQTKITFSLPSEARTDLSIFDVRGRKVVTLVNETLSAGFHPIVWKGADGAGRQVGSGVYFYRLVADGVVKTKKMTLVR